jgi:hypothetical protein
MPIAETPAGQVVDEPVATYWMVVLEVTVLFAGLLTVTVAKAGATVARKKRPGATISRRIAERVFMTLFCVSAYVFQSFKKGGDEELPKSNDRFLSTNGNRLFSARISGQLCPTTPLVMSDYPSGVAY